MRPIKKVFGSKNEQLNLLKVFKGQFESFKLKPPGIYLVLRIIRKPKCVKPLHYTLMT